MVNSHSEAVVYELKSFVSKIAFCDGVVLFPLHHPGSVAYRLLNPLHGLQSSSLWCLHSAHSKNPKIAFCSGSSYVILGAQAVQSVGKQGMGRFQRPGCIPL